MGLLEKIKTLGYNVYSMFGGGYICTKDDNTYFNCKDKEGICLIDDNGKRLTLEECAKNIYAYRTDGLDINVHSFKIIKVFNTDYYLLICDITIDDTITHRDLYMVNISISFFSFGYLFIDGEFIFSNHDCMLFSYNIDGEIKVVDALYTLYLGDYNVKSLDHVKVGNNRYILADEIYVDFSNNTFLKVEDIFDEFNYNIIKNPLKRNIAYYENGMTCRTDEKYYVYLYENNKRYETNELTSDIMYSLGGEVEVIEG